MTDDTGRLPTASATARTLPGRPVTRLLMACMVILILAQALTGALSLSALNRLAANNTADRVELAARQAAASIQNGLNLGKPLAQYFGLDRVLDALGEQVPGLIGAAVVLPGGHVLSSEGQTPDTGDVLAAINGQGLGADQRIVMASPDAARQFSRDRVRLAIALEEPGVSERGALVVDMQSADADRSGLLMGNVVALAMTTLGAAGLLVILLRYIKPTHLAGRRGLLKLIPLAVLLLAQSLYATVTINTFRSVWLEVTHANAQLVAQGVQRDLERVLSYGIAPHRMVGVEKHLAGVVQSFPVISEFRLSDAQGELVVRADAHGGLPVRDLDSQISGDLRVSLPLRTPRSEQPVASLDVLLDPVHLRSGVWARVLDAGTVAVIALVAALELLLLLELVLNGRFMAAVRGAGPVTADRLRDALPEPPGERVSSVAPSVSPARTALFARPLMFGFLFAWALPLGFLPLYARTLIPAGTPAEQLQFLMALPIAAEMGWGLMTALLAGRLTDRRGWQSPVFVGLLVSIMGSLACALTTSIGGLVVARSLVGFGYGLTWMGLQGFVVLHSPAQSRGRNMASIIAGLFAGHLSGAAVGAMLMEQVGAQAVFYMGALMFVLPLVGVLLVAAVVGRMGTHRSVFRILPAAPVGVQTSQPVAARGLGQAAAGASPVSSAGSVDDATRPGIRQLLFSRDFGLLLLASIVPFSIAQVGLLSFALPLYLEAGGFQASSVGRVLMLYGLCVIYLGPLMGRLADRSVNKKAWIVAAGLTGSAGLLAFTLLDGVVGAVVAVLCLAIASCLAGGAQAAYMLALGKVERYGAVGATSVMRAADKVGQMLGPLVVAGLFAMTSMSRGLAATGMLYLLASLMFMFWAPGSHDHRDNTGVPGS